MNCPGAASVRKLLAGVLDVADTRAAYAHLRACDLCRTTWDDGRRAVGALRRIATDADAEEADVAPQAAPPSAKPRSRVRFRGAAMLLGAVALLGLLGGVIRPSKPAETPEEGFLGATRAALSQGLAVATAPRGSHEGTPRVAVLALPSPVANARFMIFDAEGRTIYERSIVPGQEGAFAEPYRCVAPSGSAEAWRLVVPFPDDETLPLIRGAPYGAGFVLPGGIAAASAVFSLR